MRWLNVFLERWRRPRTIVDEQRLVATIAEVNMRHLLRDIRHATRALLSAPGFTLAAVLTLTLGIGANVAMFSIVYGVLLRPLPYRDADRVAIVRSEAEYAGTNRPVPVSIQSGELNTWQRRFDAIAETAFHTTSDVVALSGDSGSEVLSSSVVTSTFFSTMAGPFVTGHALDSANDAAPVVVISDRLARRLFSSPDGAVGQQLILTRQPYTVIGVADRGFQFPSADVDVWLPAGFVRSVNPRCCSFQMIARLEPDGTLERARAALQAMFENPATGQRPSRGVHTTVVRLSDAIVSPVRPALLVLCASVTLVLVIACGNLINLVLARNASREREFAVRRALGASAGRLIQQLLVESALLGTAGAIGGTALAQLSVLALPRLAGAALPRIDAVQIDTTALLFAAGLAVFATVATGLTPALRAVGDTGIPNQGSGGTATSRGARRLQRATCIVQVALAVMLLIGATLLGRSLVRLLNVDLGVTTHHVLTASLNLGFGGRPPDAQTIARISRVVEDVGVLPGVRAVGVGTSVPPNVSRMMVTLRRSGDTVDYQAAAVPATPGYFSALQMRLINGRFFTDADDDKHPPVMIMSEGTAHRFFGPGDPIGRTMILPLLRDGVQSSVEMTLVGVTANVTYSGMALAPDDVVYRPFAQQPWVAPFLVVRTAGDPGGFAQTLRRVIAKADTGVVVSSVVTLDQRVADATAQPRFRTFLLMTLAGLALGIAAIGLYGVVAYAVSRRTKEIGIRVALGASPGGVLTMVVIDGVIMASSGIAIGVAGAMVMARTLSGLLYGITPTDPLSFLVSSTALLVLTLLASYIPARRAARIDPIGALRSE
jgi:putative ABC transport system permease protein